MSQLKTKIFILKIMLQAANHDHILSADHHLKHSYTMQVRGAGPIKATLNLFYLKPRTRRHETISANLNFIKNKDLY